MVVCCLRLPVVCDRPCVSRVYVRFCHAHMHVCMCACACVLHDDHAGMDGWVGGWIIVCAVTEMRPLAPICHVVSLHHHGGFQQNPSSPTEVRSKLGNPLWFLKHLHVLPKSTFGVVLPYHGAPTCSVHIDQKNFHYY